MAGVFPRGRAYWRHPLVQGLWQLARLDKPIGSLLLLWPTLCALWLACDGVPPLGLCLIFSAGVIVMRSAGCVINDLADRHVDPHVKRTAQRPLATGAVSVTQGISWFVALLVVALGLALCLNTYSLALAGGALLLACVYPFMKRWFAVPQLILGFAFSWAILMAYAASIEALPAEAWILFFTNCAWIIAYDTQYAMVDRDDDLTLGIHSSAIWFGTRDKAAIVLCQGLTLAGMLTLGLWHQLAWPFYAALLAIAALFAYQYHLIQHRDRNGCFAAFLSHQWVGLLWFLGIGLG